ncbi:MAG: DNA methyltransferase [Candidatus Methylomirabilales bacterium]
MLFPRHFKNRLELSRHAVPRSLQSTPMHKWFVFPHSYSSRLVEEILKEWALGPKDRILDPFVGAGTTLVAAKAHGIPAIGFDLSPLAVFVTNVKLQAYAPEALEQAWRSVVGSLPKRPPGGSGPPASRILAQAFSPLAWAWVRVFQARIRAVPSRLARGMLRLALLRAIRGVCGAQCDGGWIRWTRRPSGRDFPGIMADVVADMIQDVQKNGMTHKARGEWYAMLGDARVPQKNIGTFSAVICSPPYPNRHDYTRVFAPELLLEFVDEGGLKALRYKLFRSHVEAREPSFGAGGFTSPRPLERTLRRLRAAPVTDRRVMPMIDGYFRDVSLALSALRRVLRKGARLAFVVGNVRHAGVMVEVDRILVAIAKGLGYRHDGTWLIRVRGNSAQQMGRFGRDASRESIVFLTREGDG